jgi:PAS domain S-box-containing protein
MDKKILVVEDEFITASALKVTLNRMGYDVVGMTDTGEKAISDAEQLKPNLVLMDIILKGEMNGITAADIIRQRYNIPVIYLTGQSDDTTIAHALESEPFGYIIKPFEEKNLKTSIMMALYKHAIDVKLKACEVRYRTIVELFEDGILITGNDYSVDYANRSLGHILNREKTEMIQKSLHEIVPENVFGPIKALVDDVFLTNKSRRVVQEFDVSDGRVWFDITGIPLTLADDAPRQVMMIVRDITDRITMEKKLEITGIAQMEKNMEQFQILNDEIKNPLQVIMGLTLMEEGQYQEEILNQIAIINEIVSKLDRGWIESEKVRTFLLHHYRHGSPVDDG